MNEFVDMHVHSKFSIDGMSTMEDYCLIAGKTGTRVICFTEHVDFNSAEKNLSIVKDNRKQNFVVDDYFREINRLRKKYGSLTLLSGIEFSEPSLFPEEFALYSSYPFDCITAGIHHCYNSVFPGAGNLSVSKAIYEYYQIMQKTVELGGFQVLAHLDFPKLFFDKWVIDDDVLDMILSIMIDWPCRKLLASTALKSLVTISSPVARCLATAITYLGGYFFPSSVTSSYFVLWFWDGTPFSSM